MYKVAKNLSPFTLGLVFCCSQATLLPAAHAASLNPTSSVDVTLPSAPNTVDQTVLGAPAASSPMTLPSGVANVDCPLPSGLSPSAPKNSGIKAVPKNSGNKSLNYQSNELASSDVSGTGSTPKTMATSPTLIAQAADDCCGIGGAATCEVGGVPTGGAALGGISPLLGLLGLVPAAAIPLALDDGSGSNNAPAPVDPGVPEGGPGLGVPEGGPGLGEPPPIEKIPEPPSTGAIVAGFGMMGLWLSRRHRSGRKDKNISLE